jgi:hypothetical protein
MAETRKLIPAIGGWALQLEPRDTELDVTITDLDGDYMRLTLTDTERAELVTWLQSLG